MKAYKQKEVAKIEGVEPRSVSRWNDKELGSRGWTKHGEGSGCYYTRDAEVEADTKFESRSDLEIKKLKADIALKEQKLDRDRLMLFQEWSDNFTGILLDAFSPLSKLLAESRFEEEESTKWNEAIDTCLQKLSESSKSVYRSVDMKDQ